MRHTTYRLPALGEIPALLGLAVQLEVNLAPVTQSTASQ